MTSQNRKLSETELWQEQGVTPTFECSDFFGPTKETKPIAGSGIVRAVLLVLGSLMLAFVLSELVEWLRSGR